MADLKQCEFFLLRYAPDAVKEEFVNVGVVLFEENGFADVKFTHDFRRVKCLDADADIEVLQELEKEIRLRIKDAGSDRDKIIKKLQDSFSSTLQISATKAVLAESPQKEIELLARMYLESPARERESRDARGRQAILQRMQSAFEAEGVWHDSRFFRNRAVEQYTRAGDPLKIDCGYVPNGIVRLCHAVSLVSDPDSAKILAFSFPQLAEGIARIDKKKTELTAVTEDALDQQDESTAFALETLTKSKIKIVAVTEIGRIAKLAREELRI
jgi:Protein of unknown function (DUF3037)